MGISAVIIALNEEKKLQECLRSVAWADEVIVVDSGSSDRTIEVARSGGAKTFSREFDDFSSQKNFAVKQAAGEWIFSLDADEIVTEALAAEIKRALSSDKYDGYFIPRSNIIFGREMRYGGHQNDRHLRIFRKEKGAFTGLVHEKVEIKGCAGCLTNPILHYSTASKEEYIKKLDLYTDLEAFNMRDRGQVVKPYRLFLKPAWTFLKRYFIQMGFLDGKEGFDFYSLCAYYDYLKYRKYFGLLREGGIG
ncbi:MAG TPA: glycosyltransferase family 2 protein [Candidatus Omnitrophota bacterium]|nr:glycosyltransferase family 2 protein [Candidatus Omnitrophota bacterium]